MGLYEQFPYSNFHRINLDWILRKLKQKEDRVEALEGRMDTAEADIDALEGRMDTAEGNISRLDNQINGAGGLADQVTNLGAQVTNLAGDVTNLGGRVTNLETKTGQLLNASMLEGANTPTAAASTVTLPYTKATYTNGSRTTSTDSAVIPGATSSTAGVMTAAQVQELSAATLAISKIGDAYAEALSSADTLTSGINKRVFIHDFEEGYWIVAGAIVFEVTVPASVTGTTQVNLAASISSDPNGPGWVGMLNPYFLPAGVYNIALPCSARAYKFNPPGMTGVTSNGCLWGYFEDVAAAGVTCRVLTNLTSTTGNKTEMEAVRII